jgi:hypothetical protein
MERRLIASIGKGTVVYAGWEEIDLDDPSEITVPGVLYPAFAFGKMTATRGVTALVPPGEVSQAFGRHGLCQWGLVSAEQQAANCLAVLAGGLILSEHLSSDHVRFDLLTNAERTLTIAHLPSER